MKSNTVERPSETEFNAYYNTYVSKIEGEELLSILGAQPAELASFVSGLAEERGDYRYAEGKWSMKEAISHIIDGERMFAYRLLRISRGDLTPIEGFEQDGYIENSHAGERTFADLVAEFDELRRANLRQMQVLTREDWQRQGTASGFPFSARALGYIMAGHFAHHYIILIERYAG